ncbi:MAG: glycoside hydrolase family 3 protein [Betaproteobacteria bacterium]|nr:MAG: glycoside hydrolase family 3 protein [Betaproteobacteria bacterium]
MNILDTLKLAPFNLDDEAITWVKTTRDKLSTEDKVRQIYCPMGIYDDPENARVLAALKPGGIFRLIGPDIEAAWHATRIAIESSEIPMLIAGDLEGGAYCLPYNTAALNQIGVAACDDPPLSQSIATVIAEEGVAMGYNWSFTPVLDINAKFRSAIVGTRSYGSNVETIIREAAIHIKTLQSHGIATTAKHWPGEGYDDRDQHLVTTVNPLSYEEWEAGYGRIYRTMINHGVMSVMSAHISLPSWVKKRYPNAGREAFRPGSVSRLLNVDLLRDELKFNGLVVSDATPMGGLSSWAEKEEYAPDVIQNGCDMYLFGHPNAAEIDLILKGLRTGRLTEARVEEAVTRVLGLKAALGLHKKSTTDMLAPLERVREKLRTPKSLSVSAQAVKQSITLVKDIKPTLPISVEKHKRILIISEGVTRVTPSAQSRSLETLENDLRRRGFELRYVEPAVLMTPAPMPTREDTDLVLYLLAQESEYTVGHINIDWKKLHGGILQGMTRYWNNVPTVMVSFGHMYYLYDAPFCPTYINAYTWLPDVQLAVVRKLMGEEPFEGVSPVDAFCGQEAARY